MRQSFNHHTHFIRTINILFRTPLYSYPVLILKYFYLKVSFIFYTSEWNLFVHHNSDNLHRTDYIYIRTLLFCLCLRILVRYFTIFYSPENKSCSIPTSWMAILQQYFPGSNYHLTCGCTFNGRLLHLSDFKTIAQNESSDNFLLHYILCWPKTPNARTVSKS